jgi:hypothetical protein
LHHVRATIRLTTIARNWTLVHLSSGIGNRGWRQAKVSSDDIRHSAVRN